MSLRRISLPPIATRKIFVKVELEKTDEMVEDGFPKLCEFIVPLCPLVALELNHFIFVKLCGLSHTIYVYMVTVTRLYERRQVEILIPALSSPQQPPNSPLLGVFLTTGFFKGLSNYLIFKAFLITGFLRVFLIIGFFKGLSNYWIF